MNALQVYALLNKKIKGLVSGIQSASVDGTTIKFTMNDGSVQTMVFPTPKDGASVTDLEVKKVADKYHLIGTITDANGNDTEIDAGEIPGADVSIATKDKAGIVKVGDNLEITSDGTLSAIGGGKPYEISKADYDALTEEERKDKVFYVYDDDEGYGGGGGCESELEHDITCNVSVGNAPSGTVLPQGMTFTEYAEKVHVTTLPPSIKINTPTSATHEIGEVITTLPIKATITKGTYALSKAEFYDGNTLLNTITGIPANGVVNMDYSCNNNDTNMKIKVVATDNNGLTGNASVDIKFARGIFYGTSTTGDSCNTSALVRSLSNKELGKTSGYKFTVDIPVGTKSVIIAIPATMNLSDIKFRESMNLSTITSFNISNVDVEGANGYQSVQYKVYQYIADSTFSQESHYDVII